MTTEGSPAGDPERAARIATRRTLARRRRRFRLVRTAVVAGAAVALVIVLAQFVLPAGGSSDAPDFAAVVSESEEPEQLELMGAVATVREDEAGLAMHLGVRHEHRASEARVVLVDDRNAIVDRTQWVRPGEEALLRIQPQLLGVGPIRTRLDARTDPASPARRAWLLVGEEPAAADAEVVYRLEAGRRVGLVFDDGLDGAAMARIVSVLREASASATFCLNGAARRNWDERLRSMLVSAINDGTIELCSHGYSHRTDESTGLGAAREDIARNREVLEELFGTAFQPIYRPPHGALNGALRQAAGESGYGQIVLWDVDPIDRRGVSPKLITARTVAAARPGSLVVLHLLPETATALPRMITRLRANGLEPMGAGRMWRAAARIQSEKRPQADDQIEPTASAAASPLA